MPITSKRVRSLLTERFPGIDVDDARSVAHAVSALDQESRMKFASTLMADEDDLVGRDLERSDDLGEVLPEAALVRQRTGRLLVGEFAHSSFSLGLSERGRRALWPALREASKLPYDPMTMQPDEIDRLEPVIRPVFEFVFAGREALTQDVFLSEILEIFDDSSLVKSVFPDILQSVFDNHAGRYQADATNQFGIGRDEYHHLLAIYLKQIAQKSGVIHQTSDAIRMRDSDRQAS
jgi:hypothetical protein